jgi:predicted nucleic acid-binding protein
LILYLDTSSLVKLYVEEAHSPQVKKWVSKAEIIVTCRVAYPETLSAITRRFNNGELSQPIYELLSNGFTQDWGKYVALDFDELEAGRLVAKYSLRGFDAIHLASAKLLSADHQSFSQAFSSFDKRLNEAALAEGLHVLTPDSSNC